METRISPFYSCEEDRISNLPDALIHHIFSFIDIKYAIETSILSRRWRYLWTSLPTLNFNSNLFVSPGTELNDVDAFIDFVDRVLMLRDSSKILSFYLYWQDTLDANSDLTVTNRLHTWILGAVRRNVQELSIHVDLDIFQNFQFPPCLYSCYSLTKLELNMGSKFQSRINLPNSVDLPMLKSLKLCRVSIYDENSIAKLFSSCPVLESLIIKNCYVNLENLSFPKLKHFKLKYSYEETDQGEGFPVKLYAPNLTSFVCKSYMSFDHSLENLSSLVTADIHMMLEDVLEEEEEAETYSALSAELKQLYAQRMMKLLRALHNVKDLTLSPWFLEVVSGAPNLLDRQPLQFCNLRCLELRTFLSRDCFHAITYLFKISPNIESLYLIIHKKWWDEPQMYPFCDEFNSPTIGDDWEAGLSLPCMLYHLKFVVISGAQGCINELKFLEILLKNAMVLKQLVIYCDWQSPGDMARRMKNFSKKLLKFPRASSSIFEYLCF